MCMFLFPMQVQSQGRRYGSDSYSEAHAPPPFEFAALEAVLMIACSELHKRQESLSHRVRDPRG